MRAGPENDDISGWGGTDMIGYAEPDRDAGAWSWTSPMDTTDQMAAPDETDERAIGYPRTLIGSRFADRLTGTTRRTARRRCGDDLLESADGLAEDVDCGEGFVWPTPIRSTGSRVWSPRPCRPRPRPPTAIAPLPAPPPPAGDLHAGRRHSIAIRRGRITRVVLRDVPAGGQVKSSAKPRAEPW